jgi:hypothetical protein
MRSIASTKNVALAKNGDNTTRQVTTELALCSKTRKPTAQFTTTPHRNILQEGRLHAPLLNEGST